MSHSIWSGFSGRSAFKNMIDGESFANPVVSNKGSSIGTTTDDESLASQVETGIPSTHPFHSRSYHEGRDGSAKKKETGENTPASKILPNWARVIILVFVTILIASFVFSGLFYSSRGSSGDDPQDSAQQFNFEDMEAAISPAPSLTLTESPSAPPSLTASEEPTMHHSSAPTMTRSGKPSVEMSAVPTSTPTQIPTGRSTVPPTRSPFGMPSSAPTETLATSHPTKGPTKHPTSMPTMLPTFSDLVFYVMGDVPYSAREMVKLRKFQLPSIPEDTPFIIHVGDIQNVKETNCTEMAYKEVHDVFKLSKVPIFFTPGEQDYKECPNPAEAWGNWSKYFGKFDDNFNHTLGVRRQMFRNENVALFKDYVLFIGVHIIPGTHEEVELADRLSDNLEWVISNVNRHLVDDLRSVVIFSHSDRKRDFRPFFDGFSELANQVKIPFLYVHGHGHDFELTEEDFNSPYITNLQVDKGRSALPLKVTVMREATKPFVFDRRLTPDWGAYWKLYPKNDTVPVNDTIVIGDE